MKKWFLKKDEWLFKGTVSVILSDSPKDKKKPDLIKKKMWLEMSDNFAVSFFKQEMRKSLSHSQRSRKENKQFHETKTLIFNPSLIR